MEMPPCMHCKAADGEIFIPYARGRLCPSCYINFFERKVKRTVSKYRMIQEGDRVAVAVSGGKDSSSLMHALKKTFPNVEFTGIYINLGIGGYSDECETILTDFLKKLEVDFIVYDVRKELGISVEDFKRTYFKGRLCSPCGTIKRYLLNKIAYEEGFTKLATGHNLDDLVEVLFNAYIHGDVSQLARIKPVLPSSHEKFVVKIKPLCELTERENLLYAECSKIPYRTIACPLSARARSRRGKKVIDKIAESIPYFKHAFFKSHLKKLSRFFEPEASIHPIVECKVCGMPSSTSPCAFCKRLQLVKEVNNRGRDD